MASYLDYNGLQTFWTRIKEIISAVQNDVSNLSNNKQDKTDIPYITEEDINDLFPKE